MTSTWLAAFDDTASHATDATSADSATADSATADTVPHIRLSTASPEAHLSVAARHHAQVIFDGWLYDRDALSAALSISGTTAGATDAALVLNAYLRWGEEAFDKLRGCFALCLWDDARRTLLSARDHFGVYPLFYARHRSGWLFSPSVDTLLAQPQLTRAVNREALAAHLIDRGRELEETFFSDVRRLPAGHLLRLR